MKNDFETRLLRLEQWAWGGAARVPERIIQAVRQRVGPEPCATTSIGLDGIRDELAKIERALRDPGTTDDRYCQLYAAQQALIWATGGCAAAPYEVIASGRVQPITGIPKNSDVKKVVENRTNRSES